MEKKACDTCCNKRRCNTMDRRRGMACIDYNKENENATGKDKQKR